MKRVAHPPLAVCLILLTWSATAASAQVRQWPPVLRTGTRIRVELNDGSRIVGRFVDAGQDDLRIRAVIYPTVLRAEFEDRAIARGTLARLWRDAGREWKAGALIGAPVGAATVSLLAAVAISIGQDVECNVGCWGGIVGSGLGVGALGGVVIGLFVTDWRELP